MTTIAQGNKRLLRLAEILDDVPPELYDQSDVRVKTSCGTVCCAWGWWLSNPMRHRRILREQPYGGETDLSILRATKEFAFKNEEEMRKIFDSNGCGVRLGKKGNPKKAAVCIRDFVAKRQAK